MSLRIGIVGGGPSALFLYKFLTESRSNDLVIEIFESQSQLGVGMPYGPRGSNAEHVTNVSGNEIPEIETTLLEWLETVPAETRTAYHLPLNAKTDYKVLPRLLFGQYLASQFALIRKKADKKGIETIVHLETTVTDIIDVPNEAKVIAAVGSGQIKFDSVIICTGHVWPKTHEGTAPGYFDSPYPPIKLKKHTNHTVAIRGSSLTAIDAIRTLARYNGSFKKEKENVLSYHVSSEAPDFKIVMHSRSGLLPGIRFHLDDPHLAKDVLLTREALEENMKKNDGFLSLDFVFEQDFKNTFKTKDPAFYEAIKNYSIEEFVSAMMGYRKNRDAFDLFLEEYEEARQSIRNKESIYWKEMLAVLSFAMNYPAKHLSAEDMLRLQKTLMPLISIVIAFAPQSSCEELIALHGAGRLEIIAVGDHTEISISDDGGINYTYEHEDGKFQTEHYSTFIDCIGQKHLSINEFPFKSLITGDLLQQARLKFRSPARGLDESKTNKNVIAYHHDYYLNVPGISISDSFRIINKDGAQHNRIHIMAVPYIGGYNPDYSGLDFCEEASRIIVDDIFKRAQSS